jgi:hypothetical protein
MSTLSRCTQPHFATLTLITLLYLDQSLPSGTRRTESFNLLCMCSLTGTVSSQRP